VQRRLDASPEAMRQGRGTVGHPFRHNEGGMGATHFLTKTFQKEPLRWLYRFCFTI
jgi:hypothetical protein